MVIPIVQACTPDGISPSDGSCEVSPSETEGLFPTKDPESLVLQDITSDRVGVPLSIIIIILNAKDDCDPLPNANVDIWHCDKDGYYSEYGGISMQRVDYTSAHFLRGRQVVNSAGQVGFTSIYPGWYTGRAPHIHVHVYDDSGKSLLVTQIVFPTEVSDEVYTEATNYYTKGTKGTANNRDNVFSDSLENQLAVVTGSVSSGYELTHSIIVSA